MHARERDAEDRVERKANLFGRSRVIEPSGAVAQLQPSTMAIRGSPSPILEIIDRFEDAVAETAKRGAHAAFAVVDARATAASSVSKP